MVFGGFAPLKMQSTCKKVWTVKHLVNFETTAGLEKRYRKLFTLLLVAGREGMRE